MELWYWIQVAERAVKYCTNPIEFQKIIDEQKARSCVVMKDGKSFKDLLDDQNAGMVLVVT